MQDGERSGVIGLRAAEAAIPGPDGARSTLVLKRGTLDEIYVVIRGAGALVHGGKRDAFQAGDLLFVAAGVEHHYEDFSDDLALWRIFYGANGGEVP